MKKLMIGNQAVAAGLYDGGLGVVSSYPGTPSTEITEFLSKYNDIYSEWAPNEKVAAEVAFGASLGGKRTVCCMKHVGLNVAADPLFTLSYTGVNAGMVICVPTGNPNKTVSGFWEDSTRLPEFYDGTYEYLKSLGIEEI